MLNPAAAHRMRPRDIVELQRLAGNRAVCQLLRGSGSRSAGSSPTVVQRKLKLDPKPPLPRPSDKAKRANSTLSQIWVALEAYRAIEDEKRPVNGVRVGPTREQVKAARLKELEKLDQLSSEWLSNYDKGKIAFGRRRKKDDDKKAAIENLNKAVKEERADEDYRLRYLSVSPDLIENVGTNQFAMAKLAKREKKKSTYDYTQDESQKQRDRIAIEKYESLKRLGLTFSEISALQAYTGDQYMFLNPAMAGNEAWLAANMAKQPKVTDTSAPAVAKAMETNKHIGGYVLSAMQKLPPWPGGKTLYRGETLPTGEFTPLTPGKVRDPYLHFVSTSLGLQTPQSQIGTWATKDRPGKVIYHIVSPSNKGRDVQELAKSGKSEAEILFLPGTAFRVGRDVTPNDKKADPLYKEVEAQVL